VRCEGDRTLQFTERIEEPGAAIAAPRKKTLGKRRALAMNIKAVWQLLTETFHQWNEDKPFQLAAALSYYTVFSLAPLLIIAIAVAGLVFGREATQSQIMNTMQGLVGPQGAQAIQAMIQNASTPNSGLFATIVGLVTLLLGAGGVVGQLQDSLNTIWGVVPKPDLGFKGQLRTRFISFAMVLGIGFLLLVSLVVSAGLTAFLQFVGGASVGESIVWHGVEMLVSFGFTTLLFALIYKVLPDVYMAWKDVWIGAAMTSLLFTLGKFLIGLYLGKSSVTSAYGAAGSFVVILLWVYYSSLVFFFGAEFTQAYATRYGAGFTPDAHAIAVTKNGQAPAKQTATLEDFGA
jgi:membrane protein